MALDTRRTNKTVIALALDQAASGLSSFFAVLVVTRAFDAGVFGIFALVYTASATVVGAVRSYLGVPLGISGTRGESAALLEYRQAVRHVVRRIAPLSVGFVLLVGAVACMLADQFWGSALVWIVIVALAAPLISIQDLSRYLWSALGRPTRALLSDSLWMGGMGVLMLVADSLGNPVVVGVWFVVTVTAMLVACLHLPRVASQQDLDTTIPHSFRGSLTGIFALSSGTSLIVGLIASAAMGPVAFSGIRGASTLMTPLNAGMTFLDFALLGRLAGASGKRLKHLTITMIGLGVAGWALWSGVLRFAPERWLEWMLGDSWGPTRAVLGIAIVEYLFTVSAATISLFLKSRRSATGLLVVKVISSCAILLGTALAAVLGVSIIGVAASMALGAAILLIGTVFVTAIWLRDQSRLSVSG